jgi:hypothetical protein
VQNGNLCLNRKLLQSRGSELQAHVGNETCVQGKKFRPLVVLSRFHCTWTPIYTAVVVRLSRNSVIDIVTGVGLADSMFEYRRGQEIFYSSKCPDRFCGPPSLSSTGYRFPFLLVNGQRCEADHSFPPRDEVKNDGRYASTPPICLHGVERENFIFTGIILEQNKSLNKTKLTLLRRSVSVLYKDSVRTAL